MKTNKDVGLALEGWLSKNHVKTNAIIALSVDQFITEVIKKKVTIEGKTFDFEFFPMLITGPSGSGKSWLAGQLSGRFPKLKVFHLDEYRGKNGIDFKKVPKDGDIFEGWGTGTSQFSKIFKNIVVPIPSFDQLRSSVLLKAEEGEKRGFDQSLITWWKQISEMSDSDVGKFIFDKLRLVVKDLTESQTLFVVYNNARTEIQKGWFS
jgi:energy-coupling factor transporter ATP-binding protein EcfA2